ncbi:MAG: type I pullulanase [Actinomycetales bacterium]|nr:type I pullulanase [Actinomycetales bacterium]
MKSRVRILSAVSVVFALIASALVGVSAQAMTNDTVKVKVHYQRPAGDYDTWNVYTWRNDDANGKDVGVDDKVFAFTAGEDSFGKIAQIEVSGMTPYKGLGFLVRKGTTWTKDVGIDRFLTDADFDSTGNAEIWLIQGDPTVYKAAPTVADAITSATQDTLSSITVGLSRRLPVSPAPTFTVKLGTTTVATSSVVPGPTTSKGALEWTLNFASPLTIGGAYTVSLADFGTSPVTTGAVMNSKEFDDLYSYSGEDLGNTYSAAQTSFRVWAPTAQDVQLVTYGTADKPSATATEIAMTKDVKGTWIATLKGDQNGLVYNYKVKVGSETNEAVDPYVRATTINGGKGVVVDLKALALAKPAAKPAFTGKTTDAVFYELHVRDASIDPSSGVSAANRGKFLGLTELGTKTPNKKSPTVLSAIKDLGVTHVQLLPVFDFASIDESKSGEYNWGYDPQNYNVPEGSYSSDPSNPTKRITELKQVIDTFHQNGLRAVMDVVYNHVSSASSFSMEKLVPGYFFRTGSDGNLANGTGCGNEVASERSMVRKYIVDSVKYWASEYGFDGFRFDLMGILDVKTMNQIRAELDKIDPSIVIIGEGWDMGDVLDGSLKASQKNASQMPGIAHFNDTIRDGIKGSVFNHSEIGYAQGKLSAISAVKSGVVGQVAYDATAGGGWGAVEPTVSVNYVEAHDNLTLFDKLQASMPRASAAERQRVFELSSSIAILAQGLPFIHAGQEFMRTKGGNDNSYNAGDKPNALKWNTRVTNAAVVNYFKGLIELRKSHPAFRMSTVDAVRANLKFIDAPNGVLAYSLNGAAAGDSWKSIVVAHNPNKKAVTVKLPVKGSWSIVVSGPKAGVKPISVLKNANTVQVPAQATLVLHN